MRPKTQTPDVCLVVPSKNNHSSDLWLTKEAAAQFTGYSTRKIAHLAEKGYIEKHIVEAGPKGTGTNLTAATYSRASLQRFVDDPEGVKATTATDVAVTVAPGTTAAPIQVWSAMVEALHAIARSARPSLPPLPPPPSPDYAYISLTEAGKLIGMSAQWVHAQIRAGRLPAERVGRSWRVRRCDLAALPAQVQRAESVRK